MGKLFGKCRIEDQEGIGKNNVKMNFKKMGYQHDKVDGTGSG